jgi:rare lipoprotein A
VAQADQEQWRAMVSRAALRVLVAAVLAAALASCSSSGPPVKFKRHSNEYFSEKHYGPASPRLVDVGQPVPKGGGRVVVGESYSVAGKLYTPRENPRYSKTGLASWYGEAFHGRLTANGEIYDVNGLTAAHPTLPLPSYARVTNLQNGRSLIVRVNDRGPFAHDRIIDLSSRVADMLDVKNEGTARVKVDYVGPARMDGMDERKLLASYRAPDVGAGGSMLALNTDRQPTVVLAAAPMPRVRPVFAGAMSIPATTFDDPQLLMPAYAPADDDLLAPLILRAGFTNSYAADPPQTGAQHAAADLAQPNLHTALARAAAMKADELGLRSTVPPAGGATAVVQLGSFSEPANAERIGKAFLRFGQVENSFQQRGSKSLTVVRVILDPTVTPSEVVDAAAEAGLAGAFVLGH